MNGLFEKASRMRLRFNYKGTASVEDLWNVALTDLDTMYQVLSAESQNANSLSLLKSINKKNERLELKLNIIKHIVETRLKEQKENEEKLTKAEKKKKLLCVLEEKQNQALYGMSVEELTAAIDNL